jgi:hypothetical protein
VGELDGAIRDGLQQVKQRPAEGQGVFRSLAPAVGRTDNDFLTLNSPGEVDLDHRPLQVVVSSL